jgi:hypothetical protein
VAALIVAGKKVLGIQWASVLGPLGGVGPAAVRCTLSHITFLVCQVTWQGARQHVSRRVLCLKVCSYFAPIVARSVKLLSFLLLLGNVQRLWLNEWHRGKQDNFNLLQANRKSRNHYYHHIIRIMSCSFRVASDFMFVSCYLGSYWGFWVEFAPGPLLWLQCLGTFSQKGRLVSLWLVYASQK